MISEVLAARGYNNVLRGQVAPDSRRGKVQCRGLQGAVASRTRLRALLTAGSAARPSSYYPDLVHDNHPIEPPARPEDGYHLADGPVEPARSSSSRTRRRSNPDKPFFMVLRPAGRPRAAPGSVGVGRPLRRACSTPGYEAMRPEILARQIELGLASGRARNCPASTRTASRTATGPEWRAVADAGHRASVGHVERRREAAVRSDGQRSLPATSPTTDDRLGRLIDYLDQSGELDNTLIVVISDNGSSGEGGPNGTFNEWRFFNGIADTHRAGPRAHRRVGHAGVEQPLQHRLGVGAGHAVPVLEAVGRLRGRYRRHLPGDVAGRNPGERGGAAPVRARGRGVAADDLRPSWASHLPR